MAGILTHEQKQLAFRLRGRGWRLVDIAREIGCSAPMVGLMVRAGRFTAGVADEWAPRPGCLGISDREAIVVGLRNGESLASIAGRLAARPRRSVARSAPTVGGLATRPGAPISGRGTRPEDRRSASSAPDGCTRRSRVVCSSCGRPTRSLAAYRWSSPTIRRCG